MLEALSLFQSLWNGFLALGCSSCVSLFLCWCPSDSLKADCYHRLYGIGLYDEDDRQHMKWLFKKDLAPYLWLVSYRTDEVALPAGFHLSQHPPITGYRIAITASVFLFGLAKAMLGYLGYSLATNTVDWVFGVVVTTAYVAVSEMLRNPTD